MKEDNCARVDKLTTYVVAAAKLVAPRLQPGNANAGFQWCLDELTKAKLPRIVRDVMMAKATYFLTSGAIDQAVSVLKQFERYGGDMRVKAATNLSFLYLLEGNLDEAERYAHLAISHDEYHVQVRSPCQNLYIRRHV
jgi:intraflagellar transport protein 88